MKKLSITLMFLLTVILPFGCGKKAENCTYDAYRFPVRLWQAFFPYQTGQNLTFVNEENDTLRAVVTFASIPPYSNEYYTFEETCGLSNPLNNQASFHSVVVEMDNGIFVEMRGEDEKAGITRFTIATEDTAVHEMRGIDYSFNYYGYSGTREQLESEIQEFEIALGDTIKYELVGMDDIVKDICHIKSRGLVGFYDVKNQCKWRALE